MVPIAGMPSPEQMETNRRAGYLVSKMENARALALGEKLEAVVNSPVGATAENAFMAVPGQSLEVIAKFFRPQMEDARASVGLQLPEGWKSEVLEKELEKGELVVRFRVQVPANAQIRRPYWHRNDPERDTLNIIDDARYEGLPFPPAPVEATARFMDGPQIHAVCMVRYKDSTGAVSIRPLAVAPAFSILLDPSEQVIATSDGPPLAGKADIASNLQSNGQTAIKGKFKLEAPEGWQPEPPITWVTLDAQKPQRDVDFKVVPGGRKEGKAEISSTFTEGAHSYNEGCSVVTRDDVGTFYYYQPAVQRVSIVDVKVPHELRVGYVSSLPH